MNLPFSCRGWAFPASKRVAGRLLFSFGAKELDLQLSTMGNMTCGNPHFAFCGAVV
jgi:hypothetical protein